MRVFKGLQVQKGTKLMELLEKGETKLAEKLVKCINKMSDATYEYKVVQEVRKANPDLY